MREWLFLIMRRMQVRTFVIAFLLSICFANFIILLRFLFTSSSPSNKGDYKDFGNSFQNKGIVHRVHRELTANFGYDVHDAKTYKGKNTTSKMKKVLYHTELRDIFISIKTTNKNHRSRLKVLLDTWVQSAINQTYVFTDSEDQTLQTMLPTNHVINTNCSNQHTRTALCCKMALEYDIYMNTDKRWFCHMDDDTYLNVPKLVELLQKYNHTSDWYLGKPSLNHPIEVEDRANPGQKLAFWFATGGAGFCISKSLALKMLPFAGGGKLMSAGEQIRLPDDCAIGYVINFLLHKKLTVINAFHSHLEALSQIKQSDIKDQITISFYSDSERTNVVEVNGFSQVADPTRFYSVHCYLNPYLSRCVQ